MVSSALPARLTGFVAFVSPSSGRYDGGRAHPRDSLHGRSVGVGVIATGQELFQRQHPFGTIFLVDGKLTCIQEDHFCMYSCVFGFIYL